MPVFVNAVAFPMSEQTYKDMADVLHSWVRNCCDELGLCANMSNLHVDSMQVIQMICGLAFLYRAAPTLPSVKDHTLYRDVFNVLGSYTLHIYVQHVLLPIFKEKLVELSPSKTTLSLLLMWMIEAVKVFSEAFPKMASKTISVSFPVEHVSSLMFNTGWELPVLGHVSWNPPPARRG